MTQLINSLDAAIALCISPATLRKWRWEGKGPRFIKVGRKVAYKSEDIDAFINAQSRISTSDPGTA
jgi:predicted site-specific integrase-resolvase